MHSQILPPEMDDAPAVGATEASMKFLNGLIQGNIDMETSANTQHSQAKSLALAGHDVAFIAVSQSEPLINILSAIVRLSQDDTIRGLAIHGKALAQTLFDQADDSLEYFENSRAGV